jgi:hypothetical protein
MNVVILAALPLFWNTGATADIFYDLPGIPSTGDPNFTNDVFLKYQRADSVSNKLTAELKKKTGSFNMGSDTYTVNNMSFKLRANFTNTSDPEFVKEGSSVRINGNISGLGDNGILFRANLIGFALDDDGTVIGFKTDLTGLNDKDSGNYFCADSFAAYCEASLGESVYFYNFGTLKLGDKKFREYGSAITTVPVPAAVWLFGSGLLGLVSIARRKKVAA